MSLKSVISDLCSVTLTLLGNNLWHDSPTALRCSVFHSVSLPIQRPQRSMSEKLIWSFWIWGFSARDVTSHWAGGGRADHPLFILLTGCQGPRWWGHCPLLRFIWGQRKQLRDPGEVPIGGQETLSPTLLRLLRRVDDGGNMLTWPGPFRVHGSANLQCSSSQRPLGDSSFDAPLSPGWTRRCSPPSSSCLS